MKNFQSIINILNFNINSENIVDIFPSNLYGTFINMDNEIQNSLFNECEMQFGNVKKYFKGLSFVQCFNILITVACYYIYLICYRMGNRKRF